MFRFIVKFLKILAIACIIGVSLRVIDIVFCKEKTTDIANNNEIHYEEKTQIASNEVNTEEQKETSNEETKQEAGVKQNTKEEKKEIIETKDKTKKEEKQNVASSQNIPKKTEQKKVEIKKETQKEKEYTEVKVDIAEKKECSGNNHGMSAGNSGKWFETKDEAIATYKAEIKKWGDKWTNKENPISDADYYKNCPYGYEVWNCPYCKKWTLNYYYDN